MATVVEYVLQLKDSLSKGLEGANLHAEKLEGTLKGVGEIVGVLGISMAAFAGFEALKGAHEAWEQLEKSTAKVDANLKATGQSAGLGMEELEEMSNSLQSHIKANKAEVMDMQSQLLTFPAITKEVFEDSMSMVADIAAQTNHGLSETAIMFGKAFADPEKGLQKLMRYGVMFTDVEKEKIVKLQESGHLIEAQKSMLDAIAHSGYAGVATSMFNADAAGQYEKSLYNIRLEVGELIDKLQRDLMPVALEFLSWIKTSVDWIKNHTALLWSMAKGIGAAWLAFKTGTMFIIPFVEGIIALAPAAEAAAVGMESMGAAATVSLGPLGLVAAAIFLIVTAYGQWSNAEEEAANKKKGELEKAGLDEIRQLEASTEVYEKTMDHKLAIAKAKNDEILDLQTKWLDANAKMDKLDENSSAYKNLESEANVLNKKKQTAIDYVGLLPKKKLADKATITPEKDAKTKATGSKSVTINVSIKDLIGVQNINTTNLKEGSAQIKELVTRAFTSAVNDFQVMANH